jgi:hypothetical protein
MKNVPIHISEDGFLLCCKCGDRTIEGGDPPEDVHIFPDRDEYEPGNPTGYRGGYTIVDIECACGQAMALVMGNHKGMFYVKLFRVESPARLLNDIPW